MVGSQNKGATDKSASSEKGSISAPAITLPKGGGAIRGIGEKFAANPVTGTGSMTVPIITSPGRAGFGPQLSLSYDSGSGNGPFGLGWNLSLPAITRKTDKGLPRYQDAIESDVFILSGAEDLVPVLEQDANGNWLPEQPVSRVVDGKAYDVRRYRPRIEGLFARIERWSNRAEPKDSFWRSISKDNITTWYGKSEKSRITDPLEPARTFSWLICESYDDKGNVIFYEYKEEDSAGIGLSQVNEKNRTVKCRSANRYLKRVKYGNKTPRQDGEDLSLRIDWLFEAVFDYGEGHYEVLPSDTEGRRLVRAYKDNTHDWPARKDPFSSYRAGFEVRTYRLCRRVLMFHHFPGELGTDDCLVRSTEFDYSDFDYSRPSTVEAELAHKGSTRFVSFITGVTQSGYVRRPDGIYFKKSHPPLEFIYSKAEIDEAVRPIDSESVENLPKGLDGSAYRWVDLDGEGLSGILTEQANAWFYKRNLGGTFSPVELVATNPSLRDLNSGKQQLLDLAGDGQIDLVQFEEPMSGFYERTHDDRWERFIPFASIPKIPWNDPELKFIDLTGDGHADILVSEEEVFTWYHSLAEQGFEAGEAIRKVLDEEKGARLAFADGTQSIYLADISGDGLTDIVRIRNGEVCYWPNLGYGNFGAKITMDNAPWFDHPDQFDQKRLRLADIDGSGVTDIIYLGSDGVRLFFNQSGNRWSGPRVLSQFPGIDSLSSVTAVDLLGNGTACLVWSSPLPGSTRQPMHYVQLMREKPHLLTRTVNNLGAETHIYYAPSTKFYLADRGAGKPWITRLPFPVHVVERVETYDHISRSRFVTRYAYHHGYFDGVEREFRGFGMVEQWDTEVLAALTTTGELPVGDNIEAASHVPPVLTRTWFHTGIYQNRDNVSNFFAGLIDARDRGEYYREPSWRDDDVEAGKRLLDDTVLPAGLTAGEEREACRALRGSMLRQEIYALDGTPKQDHPYIVIEQNFTIECLQGRGGNRYAVFFTHAREVINYYYERNPDDPRISHGLTLEVDAYGNVCKSLSIGYGRRVGQSSLQGDDRKKQEQTLVTYTENELTNPIDDRALYPDAYRAPLPCETRTYEVTGFNLTGGAVRFTFNDFAGNNFQALTGLPEIEYEHPTDHVKKQKRLIECVRILYRKDDLSGLLGKGALERMALPGETYKLAFTPGLLDRVYIRGGQKLLPANPADVLEGGGADRGGYAGLDGDGRWWIHTGLVFYSPDKVHTPAQELDFARKHFFLPHRFQDPFGNSTVLKYDSDESDPLRNYNLLPIETRDAVDNLVRAANDYRMLQPCLIIDPNGNRSEAAFDALGMVVGTALMGKPGENLGDKLDGFEPDLTEAVTLDHLADPLADPHVILKRATTRLVYDLFAYYRQSAYMLKAVMAYLDNLIAWGDSLFRQDSRESINEATQLYVLSANILGPRPQAVPKKGSVRPQTYANLREDWDKFGNALVDLETEIPFDIAPPPPQAANADRLVTLNSIGKSLYFCIPRNDKLLGYWDTVADRLFKIRNSLNIQGVFRQLPLFEPPIDPALLARAAAAGLDVGAIVSGANQPLPLVRFQLLAQKAAEMCQEVKSLGNNLLSAIEKGDNEAISILRARHEIATLKMAEMVKYSQLQETIKSREGLEKNLANAMHRYSYYERLLGKKENEIKVPELEKLDASSLEKMNFKADEPGVELRKIDVDIAPVPEILTGGLKLSTHEAFELGLLILAQIPQTAAFITDAIGAVLSMVPEGHVRITPFGTGAGVEIGGKELSAASSAVSNSLRGTADLLHFGANLAAKTGAYARREQEWAFQSNLAAGEITQIYKQLRAAEIREAIAEREWKNHQQQIKHAEDVEHFLSGEKNSSGHRKVSTQDFYAWMKREVKGLYSQCFQFSFDIARKAERALQHELGDAGLSFIQFGYLAGKEGLLAGEKLYMDIKRMEMAYHDLNRREYELTKHISLLQVNPRALLQLRATGRCTFYLPEELFDMDCPGHYFRRIKSVAVSVPCITGPYASINCTLTLLKSSIRKNTMAGEGYARTGLEDGRFDNYFGSLQSIVTSSGQNDSGMFETNLRDERYLPFEGSGVISEWQLELPADPGKDDPCLFDYNTISDVILHMRYTAREGGNLRNGSMAHLKTLMEEAQAAGSARLFSVRHEFPGEWAKFKSSPVSELTLNLREEHYPFWSKGMIGTVKRVDLFAKVDKNSMEITDQPDGAGNKDTLVKDTSYGKLLAGKIENLPLPAPVGIIKLYFDDKSIEDLWVIMTWGK